MGGVGKIKGKIRTVSTGQRQDKSKRQGFNKSAAWSSIKAKLLTPNL